MTAAILSITASLIGLLVLVIKRRWASKDDPQEQHEKRIERAEWAIAKNDADALSVSHDSNIERLRALQAARGGSSGNKNPTR